MSKCGLWTSIIGISGNLVEMKILVFHLRPTDRNAEIFLAVATPFHLGVSMDGRGSIAFVFRRDIVGSSPMSEPHDKMAIIATL